MMYNAEKLVGTTLSDRYHVLDKIGMGGMAMVYKAHDKVLDRDVAIKVLRESYESGSAVVSNFIKEARSSASLVHPNVVSVYDVCEFEGLNYMVMELVDGKTLKEYIKSNPRLPWQEACDYAIQIGQGILAAHERNIIHRDIKPQNIIMAPGGVLKVTDFGIAKAMESDKSIAGGTAMGSVHYISPEQARGGYTDFRSDIYSLGVVLYEMLAGRVPFDGDSPVSVALMHIEEDAVNVKCVNMDVPADLAYVTMKAMNREQSKRYQDIQELLEDLRAVLADESLPSKENISPEEAEESDFDDIDKIGVRNEDIVNLDRDARVKKKAKEKVIRNRAERNAIILALSTVAALMLIVAGIIIMTTHPFSKTVPSFINMTIEEAYAEAKDSGYKICDKSEFEYTFSDTVPRNSVVSQIPEPGTESPRTEPVKLIISLGISGGGIVVPDLTEFPSVDDAISHIGQLSLKCDLITEYSNTVETGEIIRQIPIAGTHVKTGDEVKIYMSMGPQYNNVPTGNTTVSTEVTPEVDEVPEETAQVSDAVGVTPQPDTDTVTQTTETDVQPVQTQMYKVKIPDASGDRVHVKIVANGVTIHDAVHSKTEGSVMVEIPGEGSISVQAYIDGALASDKTITY